MTSAKGHPVWPLITLGPQNLSWSFCTPFFLDPGGNFLSLMFWVTWKHGAIIWRMQIHTSSSNANKPIILSDLVWMLKNSGIFFLKMCTRYHIQKIAIISWKIHLFPKRIIQTWQTNTVNTREKWLVSAVSNQNHFTKKLSLEVSNSIFVHIHQQGHSKLSTWCVYLLHLSLPFMNKSMKKIKMDQSEAASHTMWHGPSLPPFTFLRL